MFRCPQCKSSDGYSPGEKCLHCGYLENDQAVIDRVKGYMKTDRELMRCPRCTNPDAYTPGQPCLHCGYVEKDPQIIELTQNAQLQIPRSAFLRCPKCKNSDAYTPGEKCIHCGYLETNLLLVKRAKEIRYRILPLMRSLNFSDALKFMRGSIGQHSKYRPIEGALLEYEYAFTMLFSDNIKQIYALQNLYRVLAELGAALDKVLKNKSPNDNNRMVLTKLRNFTRVQYTKIKEEFNKQNWALTKKTLTSGYPSHARRKDYFQKGTTVTDVLGALNGMTSMGFKAASLLWNVSEAVLEGAGTVTGAGSFVLAPFSIAENVIRGKRDAKLEKQFRGTAMKAGETILDLSPEKQKQMLHDALNPNISSSEFAKKWGGRIDYGNVKAWNNAAETHQKGKRRRTKRVIATIVGTGLAIGAIVVTCGTAAVVLGVGATTMAVLKLGDSAKAMKNKRSKSEIREDAAKEILNSAITGEINAINLLGGLKIIKYPNHAKYLGFSDIYPSVVGDIKKYLNPA